MWYRNEGMDVGEVVIDQQLQNRPWANGIRREDLLLRERCEGMRRMSGRRRNRMT